MARIKVKISSNVMKPEKKKKPMAIMRRQRNGFGGRRYKHEAASGREAERNKPSIFARRAGGNARPDVSGKEM